MSPRLLIAVGITLMTAGVGAESAPAGRYLGLRTTARLLKQLWIVGAALAGAYGGTHPLRRTATRQEL